MSGKTSLAKYKIIYKQKMYPKADIESTNGYI